MKLPKIWKKHGNNILLLLLLICAAFAFWNFRRGQNRKMEMFSRNNLAVAWDSVRELQTQYQMLDLSDNGTAARMQRTRQALEQFDAIMATNPKPYLAAWATLGRGEVYWLMANAPADAMATTQALIGPTTQSSEEYLSLAEDAYKQVISNHTDQRRAVSIALFSLAAIEENRRAFDQAATWYDKLIDSASATPADKSLARRRKELLDEYRHPLLIEGRPTPSSQPAT